MNLFEYKNIGPEIEKLRNRVEDGVFVHVKVRKVKNVGFLYIQKHTSAAAYLIRLTFVYILYSLYYVCMYKKHTKAISVS